MADTIKLDLSDARPWCDCLDNPCTCVHDDAVCACCSSQAALPDSKFCELCQEIQMEATGEPLNENICTECGAAIIGIIQKHCSNTNCPHNKLAWIECNTCPSQEAPGCRCKNDHNCVYNYMP